MKRITPKAYRPVLQDVLGSQDKSRMPDNNSSSAQRASILHWFLNKSRRLSTLDARDELGIMSPAPRMGELRHKFGYEIDLEWTRQKDSTGTEHRVGVYVYMGHPNTTGMEGC